MKEGQMAIGQNVKTRHLTAKTKRRRIWKMEKKEKNEIKKN